MSLTPSEKNIEMFTTSQCSFQHFLSHFLRFEVKNWQHITNPKDLSGRSQYTKLKFLSTSKMQVSKNITFHANVTHAKSWANHSSLESSPQFSHPGIGSEEYIAAYVKSEPSNQSQHVDCIIATINGLLITACFSLMKAFISSCKCCFSSLSITTQCWGQTSISISRW